MKPKNDRQAFPDSQAPGMTLRQWYAGQALAGIMADPASVDMPPEESARLAVRAADALLAALDE